MTTTGASTGPLQGASTSVDLRADGVLFMLNTVLFHPRGFALAYYPATDEFALFGTGDERWSFSEEGEEKADNDRLWKAFHALLIRQAKTALGL